ncbi:MAG: hypothetical protein LBR80_02710 [Deltaproteobacteria bacterium]|jgi:hypothetical protein|nr:hypothetical protein [Deltaproteobacteria bacterium]
MSFKKALKLLAFDAGVAALYPILLAKPFLGRFLESPLYAMPACAVLLAASIAFVFVNWKALTRGMGAVGGGRRGDPVQGRIDELNGYVSSHSQTFRADLLEMADQLDMFKRKKYAIRQALLKKFQPTELAFTKFSSAADLVGNYLVKTAGNVLDSVNSFDEEEYEKILNDPRTTRDEFDTRKQIYNHVISEVSDRVSEGGKGLAALDKLLVAVSTMGHEQSGTDSLVRGIDDAVKDLEFYKEAAAD